MHIERLPRVDNHQKIGNETSQSGDVWKSKMKEWKIKRRFFFKFKKSRSGDLF